MPTACLPSSSRSAASPAPSFEARWVQRRAVLGAAVSPIATSVPPRGLLPSLRSSAPSRALPPLARAGGFARGRCVASFRGGVPSAPVLGRVGVHPPSVLRSVVFSTAGSAQPLRVRRRAARSVPVPAASPSLVAGGSVCASGGRPVSESGSPLVRFGAAGFLGCAGASGLSSTPVANLAVEGTRRDKAASRPSLPRSAP